MITYLLFSSIYKGMKMFFLLLWFFVYLMFAMTLTAFLFYWYLLRLLYWLIRWLITKRTDFKIFKATGAYKWLWRQFFPPKSKEVVVKEEWYFF